MEKLLRECARKRRDEAGAPFELHPATRRMLQGEVARRFAKPAPEPGFFSRLLGNFGPRLAWGVGILAVLALAVAILIPSARHQGRDSLMAKNDREQPSSKETESRSLAPAAPAGTPAELASAKVGDKMKDGLRQTPTPAAPEIAKAQSLAEPPAVSLANRPQSEPSLSFGLNNGQSATRKSSFDSNSSNSTSHDRDENLIVLEKGRVLSFSSNMLGETATPASFSPTDMLARLAALPRNQNPLLLSSADLKNPASQSSNLLDAAHSVQFPAITPERAENSIAAATPPPSSQATVARSLTQSIGGAAAKEAAGGLGKDEVLKFSETTSTQAQLALKSPAAATPPAVASFAAAKKESIATPAPEAADALKQQSVPINQRFARSESQTKAKSLSANSSAANQILASFQVQQTGQQLRVIDADDSVYAGSVQALDSTRRQPRPVAQSAPRPKSMQPLESKPAIQTGLAPEKALQNEQSYSFQVIGTNRSLGKRVVFTGNLTAAPELKLLDGAATNVSNGAILQNTLHAPSQTQWSNSRISGKAVIGTREEIEIDALPAKP
jgi:hypothetical protein